MFSQIVQSLDDAGYRFVFPDEVLVPPEPEAADWIATYRERSVHIPIALEAWCLEVGSINLMGSHPDWGQSGYAFENRSGEYPLITDPFVCELSASYIDYLYDEWLSTDSEDRDPFRLDISPDHLHKANISGGPPYQLDTYKPEVDPLVFNQRFCASLVGSIRYAIRWRGFPGFEYIANKEPWSTIGPAEI